MQEKSAAIYLATSRSGVFSVIYQGVPGGCQVGANLVGSAPFNTRTHQACPLCLCNGAHSGACAFAVL